MTLCPSHATFSLPQQHLAPVGLPLIFSLEQFRSDPQKNVWVFLAPTTISVLWRVERGVILDPIALCAVTQDESEDEEEAPPSLQLPAVSEIGSRPGIDPSSVSQVDASESGPGVVPAPQSMIPPQLESPQMQLIDEPKVTLPEEPPHSGVRTPSVNSEQSEGNGDGGKSSSQLEHPLSLI